MALKSIRRRDFMKRMREFGFQGPVSGGKHQFMKRGKLKVRIPNPHGAGDISSELLSEILRQAGIATNEWTGKEHS